MYRQHYMIMANYFQSCSPIHSPTSNVQKFPLLYILANIWYFSDILIVAILEGLTLLSYPSWDQKTCIREQNSRHEIIVLQIY